MVALEYLLNEIFPELEVDHSSIPETSDITPTELTAAIQYIRDNKLVQDSLDLLSGTTPLRSSVSYQIIFPNQTRDLKFRVDWRQGPNVFVGYIQSKNHVGDDVSQARMYGMRLNHPVLGCP